MTTHRTAAGHRALLLLALALELAFAGALGGARGGALGGLAAPARAAQPADATAVELHGYAQLWWTVYEGAENGLRQPVTQEAAADHASGFLLRRARANGDFRVAGVRGRLGVRLEGSPIALLDAYAIVPLRGEVAELWAGQMKIPSTYEIETPSETLDFATLGRFSEVATDYALSRSPALASRLTGIRSCDRDLGVGVKGAVTTLRYFFMVGNGLGANRFIGGPSTRKEIYANAFGAYFYAARLAWRPLPMIELGGHASWNDHPNAVLDDRRTVLDIRRASASADVHAALAGRFELTAMYGAGRVEDDIDNDGRTDYRYRGWEAKLIAQILPRRLRAGLRYDAFAEESYDNGAEDILHTGTIGAAWFPRAGLRLQAEYQRNELESDTNPDRDDDLFLLTGQIIF